MKKRILLIEDDTTLLQNTRELLELSGYEVFTAQNGEEGIDLALEKLPDLIISDIMMPKANGYEVYKALQKRNKTREIPFIFLSVKANPEDVRRGMNLGADDYITKPFREVDLLTAIASRLAKHDILRNNFKNSTTSPEEAIYDLDGLREYFLRSGEIEEFHKLEEIFRETGNASYVYLVEEGLIKTYRLDEYGKELITGLVKKNDFLGFYSFKTPSAYPETAQALQNSKLYRITTEHFVKKIAASQNLMLEFGQLISDNLITLKDHLLDMAYSSMLKKTTNTILEFAEKIQESPRDHIRISRSDLASVAGISTESFIRSLSSLKKDGLIDIVGRDIKILDLEKLHEIK
ncbi:response regulator [Salinimicrobium soli]|uniref:response regulator n=1 Tax=Salinimicrobium soli TaxID=1254399 RepID=UPI003AACF806